MSRLITLIDKLLESVRVIGRSRSPLRRRSLTGRSAAPNCLLDPPGRSGFAADHWLFPNTEAKSRADERRGSLLSSNPDKFENVKPLHMCYAPHHSWLEKLSFQNIECSSNFSHFRLVHLACMRIVPMLVYNLNVLNQQRSSITKKRQHFSHPSRVPTSLRGIVDLTCERTESWVHATSIG